MRGALVPMGIWINILTLGAIGQSMAARQQLVFALPLALRSFVASSRGTREYVGELPRAVTRFRYSLSDAGERALLEALEHEFVDAGYRPVAWHNVFWNLVSEYERLRLAIETREPFRATDQELAAHIVVHYPEVTSTSRPVIVRRRQKLYAECVQKIRSRFLERFADRTQGSSDHTDS